MNIRELVTATKAYILKKYLDESDTRPWAVAFSGGKDSTAVLGLLVSVIESLPPEKRNREIHVVMSNTKVETPLVDDHMVEQKDLVEKHAREKNLPVSVTMVKRQPEESYFVKVLGMGYFLPYNNGQGRWCTHRLKIQPQDRHLKEINPSYILTGVRKTESHSRRKSIEKWQLDEFIGRHVSLKDRHTFNPIIHWTIEDVWKFLELEGLSWGSTLSVRTIYKDATGECGFTNPEGTEGKHIDVCGARHGCWLCPVILKDKSTEKMSEKHPWLEPLTNWRELQIAVYGNLPKTIKAKKRKRMETVIKRRTKSGHNRKGKHMKNGQGTLTVEARKYLLEKLLETQELVNRIREMQQLSPLELIAQEEIDLIKQHWKDDEENKPYLMTGTNGKFEDIIPFIEK